MGIDLKGKSLASLKNYSHEEINYLVDLAIGLKKQKKAGVYNKHLLNKNIALIFEKPSTRTRCAFTVAANDEGAFPEYLGVNDIQLGHKETVKDTARVLGRMFDGIEFRGFSQKTVDELIEYSGVPVWNGLTDADHPTQALADLMTIKEYVGHTEGVRVVYVGDGRNNVANALMIAISKVGGHFVLVSPKELYPSKRLMERCSQYAQESSGSIKITDDFELGVKGADVIYTDVWVSMGEEAKSRERVAMLKPYQVDQKMMDHTGRDTYFMHCLPVVRGNEVTDAVFEGKNSVVFDQAENRMHTIKAVMVATLTDADKIKI